MTLQYPKNAATVLVLPPLDPDGVKRIDVKITAWLNGATLSAQTWTASSGITIGNGVLTKATGNGTATPAAPSAASNVLTAFVFSDAGATENRRYVVTVSLKASDGKYTDRSFGFLLAER